MQVKGQIMRKILFISQDPGGTNVLIPIIKKIRDKCHVEVLAKDHAVSIYNQRRIPYTDVMELVSNCDIKNLKGLFLKYSPDLIVTGTCVTDFFERNAWIAARELGIKSVVILDSWCNYGRRFSKLTYKDDIRDIHGKTFPYLPDKILVIDEYSKAQMIAEGIDSNLIEIIGQPFLEDLREIYKNIRQEEIRKYKRKLLGNSERKIIVFASDHLSDSYVPSGMEYWGYDEKTIFNYLYNAVIKTCSTLDKYAIVIRPHPKEALDNWTSVVSSKEGKRIQIVIDDSTKEELVIASADIVIGMWSMFLIEAVLANKRIMSVQIGSKRRAEFMLTDQKLITPIVEEKKLEEQLREFFIGNTDIGRVKWEIEGGAVDKAVLKIRGYMDN